MTKHPIAEMYEKEKSSKVRRYVFPIWRYGNVLAHHFKKKKSDYDYREMSHILRSLEKRENHMLRMWDFSFRGKGVITREKIKAHLDMNHIHYKKSWSRDRLIKQYFSF